MILYNVVDSVFRIFEIAILIECIASWIPQIRYNKFIEIIHMITEPVLEPFRRLQYRFLSNMPIDFSPIIALLAMDFIRMILVAVL
ncbi:YggT family protein [Clostridium sp. SM-530-WT-3G]|uniref:YggT family protein n=1 Tax=Clostridium sp. SM-530-WT-3G TaxID=2725303 RepID=UPI000EE196E9|nr:YggT family protein [Clostridium sp. SM-530-WT-3G]NME83465.1 YggT family protein [Clostridium sp. SM-530-WT-3G]HCW54370.1 YggT family protein [Clostridium sp.]